MVDMQKGLVGLGGCSSDNHWLHYQISRPIGFHTFESHKPGNNNKTKNSIGLVLEEPKPKDRKNANHHDECEHENLLKDREIFESPRASKWKCTGRPCESANLEDQQEQNHFHDESRDPRCSAKMTSSFKWTDLCSEALQDRMRAQPMVACYNALVAQAGTPDPRQDADEI